MTESETAMTGPDPCAYGTADHSAKLHTNVKIAWLISSLILACMLSVGVIAMDVSGVFEDWVPKGAVSIVIGGLLFVRALLWPRLRYRHWSYAIRENDVVVAFGVLTRRRICVPRLRVQHVDIESGPIERYLGLCHLSLHTAGSNQAAAMIYGIAPKVAEDIRSLLVGDSVRAHDAHDEDMAQEEDAEAGATAGQSHDDDRPGEVQPCDEGPIHA